VRVLENLGFVGWVRTETGEFPVPSIISKLHSPSLSRGARPRRAAVPLVASPVGADRTLTRAFGGSKAVSGTGGQNRFLRSRLGAEAAAGAQDPNRGEPVL